jgi:hypothetical protein
MPSPAAEAMQHAPVAAAPAAAARHISTINPLTGLSTDYLNHFTEAVMVLEMAITMPECLDDLRSWGPKTYREHFATCRFADRDAVVATYEAADPVLRDALNGVSQNLNTILLEARDALYEQSAATNLEAIAQRAVNRAKSMIAHAAAIINGTNAIDERGTQASVDAVFAR